MQNKEILNTKKLNEKSLEIIKNQLKLATNELENLKKLKKLSTFSKEIQVSKKDL